MLTNNPGWIKVIKVSINSFTFMKIDYIRYIMKHISPLFWTPHGSCNHLIANISLSSINLWLLEIYPFHLLWVSLVPQKSKRFLFIPHILSWCWQVGLVSLWKLHIFLLHMAILNLNSSPVLNWIVKNPSFHSQCKASDCLKNCFITTDMF